MKKSAKTTITSLIMAGVMAVAVAVPAMATRHYSKASDSKQTTTQSTSREWQENHF